MDTATSTNFGQIGWVWVVRIDLLSLHQSIWCEFMWILNSWDLGLTILNEKKIFEERKIILLGPSPLQRTDWTEHTTQEMKGTRAEGEFQENIFSSSIYKTQIRRDITGIFWCDAWILCEKIWFEGLKWCFYLCKKTSWTLSTKSFTPVWKICWT